MARLQPVKHGRDHVPYGADPIPGIGGILPWCIALSGSKSVASSTSTSTLFDFTGGLTTNDAVTFTLVTQASTNKTPSINSSGVYLIYILAQSGAPGGAPAAGSGLKITDSIYGNEPIGNPTTGLYYADVVTGSQQAKAVWLWMLGLGGGGSSAPFSGELGVRQNSGFSANVTMTFAAVRIDPAGANIA